MKLITKILLFLLALSGMAIVAVCFYLFLDTAAYPQFQVEGLQKYLSKTIPPGMSPVTIDSNQKNVRVEGEFFKDIDGRVMNLRGINVSANCKLPFLPRIPSHLGQGFFESAKTVSFVGRPFPVSEADVHFARLKSWGFQLVRLLITWEAIEHEGPGQYDQAYLDYIYQIARKAQEYDINIFIDPHQDVWSRFSGGDGAPLWTLEKAGFNVRRFSDAGSAVVHNLHGEPFPKMIWPTNESKLGAATMFTLFFGGNDFAPETKVGDTTIQDYLQDHYIAAICQLALKLRYLPNVIGFDTMNEPSAGYIGLSKLDTLPIVRIGAMPTYLEGMIAGDGNAVEVGEWKFELKGSGFTEVKKAVINQAKARVWLDSAEDIWQRHGVWGYNGQKQPVLLAPNYFTQVNKITVNFSSDYWKPFVLKFAQAIQEIDGRWIIFAEPALFTKLPGFSPEESWSMVNAGHWYDGVTMLTRKYISWINADEEAQKLLFGKKNIREHFNQHLGALKAATGRSLGENPTLIGEFGTPFDLNDGAAFKSGDFSDQEAVLDRSFNAIEANLLNYTLWNYDPENENDRGDQWNGEDFSVYSLGQRKGTHDLNDGGRALSSVIRPYPHKLSGVPLQFFFNKGKGEFFLKFWNDPTVKSPTEIFVPKFHFGKGYEVYVTRGRLIRDINKDLLLYFPEGEGEHVVALRKIVDNP